MSYEQRAKLDLLDAVQGIQSEEELNEFRSMIARYFAQKAQKEIDAMWDKGIINEQTIEQWGHTHMRTPYRYATHSA